MNAKIKASPIADTPKQAKKRTSRKRPRTRETMVSPLTREIELLRLAMLKRLPYLIKEFFTGTKIKQDQTPCILPKEFLPHAQDLHVPDFGQE